MAANKEYKSTEAHVRAVMKHNKKSYWHYNLSLNRNTDAELIEMLDGADNKLGLIKDALRDYAKKLKRRAQTETTE
jgi:hypothetical protein